MKLNSKKDEMAEYEMDLKTKAVNLNLKHINSY